MQWYCSTAGEAAAVIISTHVTTLSRFHFYTATWQRKGRAKTDKQLTCKNPAAEFSQFMQTNFRDLLRRNNDWANIYIKYMRYFFCAFCMLVMVPLRREWMHRAWMCLCLQIAGCILQRSDGWGVVLDECTSLLQSHDAVHCRSAGTSNSRQLACLSAASWWGADCHPQRSLYRRWNKIRWSTYRYDLTSFVHCLQESHQCSCFLIINFSCHILLLLYMLCNMCINSVVV